MKPQESGKKESSLLVDFPIPSKTDDMISLIEKFKKSALSGDPKAQCNLSFFYVQGLGVEQNETEALKWFIKAAEQGHPIAQFNLGVFYEHGRGVKQNYEEVVHRIR